MSTLTYSATRANTLQGYTRNVTHAARLLWGALLARKPAQIERRESRRQKLEAVIMLNGMAQELENTMPNLSAELRYLAARG